jgi:hypothetical protein
MNFKMNLRASLWVMQLECRRGEPDGAAKILLLALWAFAPWKGEPGAAVVWPSRRTLAERTGQSEAAVRDQLGRLARLGWIRRTRKGWDLAWEQPFSLEATEQSQFELMESSVATVEPVSPNRRPSKHSKNKPKQTPLTAIRPSTNAGSKPAPHGETIERVLAAQRSAIDVARKAHKDRDSPPWQGEVREGIAREIRARLTEGYSEADCMHVLEMAAAEWLTKPQSLRWSTLTPWRATSFGRHLEDRPRSPRRAGKKLGSHVALADAINFDPAESLLPLGPER